jgi:hypothetical protein
MSDWVLKAENLRPGYGRHAIGALLTFALLTLPATALRFLQPRAFARRLPRPPS